MFLVANITTINPGTNLGSTFDSTKYDEVHAFIITQKIITTNDSGGDGLLIKGAIIQGANNISGSLSSDSENNDYLRKLSLTANLNTPSEAIYYDGTKYMYLFEDIFTYQKTYVMREKQFVGAYQ